MIAICNLNYIMVLIELGDESDLGGMIMYIFYIQEQTYSYISCNYRVIIIRHREDWYSHIIHYSESNQQHHNKLGYQQTRRHLSDWLCCNQ